MRGDTAVNIVGFRSPVRPRAEVFLRADGKRRVRRVIDAIDAVEAGTIDACNLAPDHRRPLAGCLAAEAPFRPHKAERNSAWLHRQGFDR